MTLRRKRELLEPEIFDGRRRERFRGRPAGTFGGPFLADAGVNFVEGAR